MIPTAFLGLTVWTAYAGEASLLIERLGSPRFVQREAASRRLVAIGEPAWPSLRKAATNTNDAEIRRRLESILRLSEDAAAVRKLVGSLVEHLCNEDFPGINKRCPGLEEPMQLPSGDVVAPSFLRHQAKPIIAKGPDAVPHLLKHVSAPERQVRYVVYHALVTITGIHAEHKSMEMVSKRWRKWYDAQLGVSHNRQSASAHSREPE